MSHVLPRLLLCFFHVLWALLLTHVPAAMAYELEVGHVVDASRRWGVADVQALPEAQWHSSRSGEIVSLGYTDAAVWFRIRMRASVPAQRDTLVELGHPRLERLEIYAREAGGPWPLTPLRLGIDQPFAERLVVHRGFLVPVTLPADQSVEWLVRVEGETAIQFPVAVHERTAFFDADQGVLLAHGAYIGVALSMLIYNFYVFFTTRDRAYLWYVLWVTCITGFTLTMSGLSFQWLWPTAATWNLRCLPVLLAAAVVSGLMFLGAFVRIREASRTGARLLRWLVWVQSAVLLMAVAMPYRYAVQTVIASVVPVTVLAIALCVVLSVRGVRQARVVVFTFSVVVLSGCVYAMSRLGWLSSSGSIENAPQIGSAIEMILFSMVLAARNRDERRQHEALQQSVIQQQQRWNSELEEKVSLRTEELERANRSLETLSRTDALTGLFNRRHLDDCFRDELDRRRVQGTLLAVFMIDIDHFKRINDRYGHAAGDLCLREVAERLRFSVRAGQDVLVRYGGEEFCAFMQVTDESEASRSAERLRARVCSGPVCWGDEALEVTVSVGVSVGRPDSVVELLSLQQGADDALYAAKAAGRNQWRLGVARPRPG